MTLTADELLQIVLSISAAAILFSWTIASRLRQTLARIELKHGPESLLWTKKSRRFARTPWWSEMDSNQRNL
jgi:hypothetical protein